MAPAKTGKDNINNTAVIPIAQTNKGSLSYPKPPDLMLLMVASKLIAPNNELTPARCKDTITKSTEPPLCDTDPDNGGYIVHPVPAPCSTHRLAINKTILGNNNHQDRLFSLGYDMSGLPICTGKR